MELYDIIRDQLKRSGIKIDSKLLAQTDILEYMLLEAANCLELAQNEKLFCRNDGESLYLGHEDVKFKPLQLGPSAADKAIATRFNQIEQLILHKLDLKGRAGWMSHNRYGVLTTIDITKEKFKRAITQSSLYIAAGDLSELNLPQLLMLREKIQYYQKIKRLPHYGVLLFLTEELTTKLTKHIEDKFTIEDIAADQLIVTRQHAAQLTITQQEIQFNQLFSQLQTKIWNLPNDKDYQSVAALAKTLEQSICNARNDFFNEPPSLESAAKFKQACEAAIHAAREEFSKFRGFLSWYNDVHPVLRAMLNLCKALVGIVAGVTIIPALVTQKYCTQGYFATFFKTQTDSQYQLERFEEGLSEKDGIIANVSEMAKAFQSSTP